MALHEVPSAGLTLEGRLAKDVRNTCLNAPIGTWGLVEYVEFSRKLGRVLLLCVSHCSVGRDASRDE